MSRPFCLLLFVSFITPALVRAEPPTSLTPAELSAVERLCVRLVGTDHRRWGQLWEEFRPFARDTANFDHGGATIVCSAGCGGSIALRGGYRVHASGPNWPPGSPRWQLKSNVVDTVILYKGKRQVLTLNRNEDDPSSVFIATNRKELLDRLPASR